MDLEKLPEELRLLIVEHVAVDPPSVTTKAEVPDAERLRRDETPLKNLSLVSRAWRERAIPVLYRHVQVTGLDPASVCYFEGGSLDSYAPGFLAFAERHDLGRLRSSLLVTFWFDDNQAFVPSYDGEPSPRRRDDHERPVGKPWRMFQPLVRLLRPSRLVVVAPFDTIDDLCLCSIDWSIWSFFRTKYQRLELERTDANETLVRQDDQGLGYGDRAIDGAAWNTLYYHHGSHARVYAGRRIDLPVLVEHGYPLKMFLERRRNLAHLHHAMIFPTRNHMMPWHKAIMWNDALRTLSVRMIPSSDAELLQILDDRGFSDAWPLDLNQCWADVRHAYEQLVKLCIERTSKARRRPLELFTSLDVRDETIKADIESIIARRAPGWVRCGDMSWIPDMPQVIQPHRAMRSEEYK